MLAIDKHRDQQMQPGKPDTYLASTIKLVVVPAKSHGSSYLLLRVSTPFGLLNEVGGWLLWYCCLGLLLFVKLG
jgi:hypothetical protein